MVAARHPTPCPHCQHRQQRLRVVPNRRWAPPALPVASVSGRQPSVGAHHHPTLPLPTVPQPPTGAHRLLPRHSHCPQCCHRLLELTMPPQPPGACSIHEKNRMSLQLALKDVQIVHVGQDLGLFRTSSGDLDSVHPGVLPDALTQGFDGADEKDHGEEAALMDPQLYCSPLTQETIYQHLGAYICVQSPYPAGESRRDAHLLQGLKEKPV
ncbi:uncharacterized protein LOC112550064 [Alligator sinensis]|uniref:Uncharacterized protein LOC112550064 n=1 Tax=Alligator sinensis TaxID=38654 RepID=A0A3Q0GJ15_ALLSI|nr:uncharacterized protein LOC112550064 [Alligator sinensis]